jgi:saccharopepsin
MKLFPLLLALLPFVSANRIHKLQLHKIPSVAANAELESAYLAEKYGAPQSGQLPLLGSGGSGRRMQRPTMRNGEQLLWTQEHINGGHPVPLTSNPFCFSSFHLPYKPPRFYECAVLHRDHSRYTSSESILFYFIFHSLH